MKNKTGNFKFSKPSSVSCAMDTGEYIHIFTEN